ncbi:hypothetical protein BGW36DRAFT_142305 [Talaromyces proteolyticus]|uniref:Stress-associated endoplasmic reticulum protein n=1 Tax=Talaromyces proteolyticus TaxID=1131652 RepID=A0AAD4Q168_9EURO|nr:uncharacterized protein BGW36DRAFT_142305 [Talaromyces proteolyticus]KAH8698248.1 hypothetical protein BGW36DRAFT_142305 [Talaromyces proteolyticus]
MAQTPKQRRANEKYAKHEAAKRGKPETTLKKSQKQKSPVSIGWVVILAFVVCGGLAFELLRIVPDIWSAITSLVK